MEIKKPKKFRSDHYLATVRLHPCVMCQKKLTEAHHDRRGDGGVGLRPSDTWCIPLCTTCHREIHSGKTTVPFDLSRAFIIENLTRYLADLQEEMTLWRVGKQIVRAKVANFLAKFLAPVQEDSEEF